MEPDTSQASPPEAQKKAASPDAREVLRRLQEVSPTFRDCRPLALGIDKAIQARFPEFERKIVRSAMRLHVSSTRYLKAVEKGTERFDLEGKPEGELTEEHRAHAAQTLKERFAAAAKRKRDQEQEELARRREEEAEQRKAERLSELVGKFSKRS